MANGTATIRGAAEKAGVSTGTVSRVLSGAGTMIPISRHTRERVRQAARELGYRPHPSARALTGKGTNLLGVIVREMGGPWAARTTIRQSTDDIGQKAAELLLEMIKQERALGTTPLI